MKTSYTDQPGQILDRLSARDPRLKRKKQKPARNPLKAFCAVLQRISNVTHRTVIDEFKAFCCMSACAMSCAVDAHHREEREKRYLAMMNVERYDSLEIRRLFPELLAIMIDGLSEKHRDFLGEVYTELDMRGHDGLGQVWTPYAMSQTMAKLTLLGAEEILQRERYISIYEPSSGTGTNVIAAAEVLLEQDINPQTRAYVVAQDVDLHAVHMTYIQLTLYGLPARVVLGDTLKDEEREQWFTFRHFLDGWGTRLVFERGLREAHQLLMSLEGGDDADPEPGTPPGFAVVLANPPHGRKWQSSQAAK